MTIEEKIRNEIGIVLAVDADEILLDKPLIEYGLDSVRVMDLVAGIEDLFDIDIDDKEVAGLHSLGDILKFVTFKTEHKD